MTRSFELGILFLAWGKRSKVWYFERSASLELESIEDNFWDDGLSWVMDVARIEKVIGVLFRFI